MYDKVSVYLEKLINKVKFLSILMSSVLQSLCHRSAVRFKQIGKDVSEKRLGESVSFNCCCSILLRDLLRMDSRFTRRAQVSQVFVWWKIDLFDVHQWRELTESINVFDFTIII